jgi:hypothetical protein
MTDTPELTHEVVAEISQLHENFLSQLESLAISAIASGNWDEFEDFVNDFRLTRDVEIEPNEDPLAELWAIAFQRRHA